MSRGPKLSVIPARALDDRAITPALLRTLAVVCMYASTKTATAFPSLSQLAKHVGISRPALSQNVARLVELGYLHSEPRYDENGGQLANLYEVLYDPELPSDRDVHPLSAELTGVSRDVTGGVSHQLKGGVSATLTPHTVSERERLNLTSQVLPTMGVHDRVQAHPVAQQPTRVPLDREYALLWAEQHDLQPILPRRVADELQKFLEHQHGHGWKQPSGLMWADENHAWRKWCLDLLDRAASQPARQINPGDRDPATGRIRLAV